MTINMRFTSVVLVFAVAVMMSSCNLDDFNMNKLAKANAITPDLFAPLAYGTFKVSDFVSVPIPDTTKIPTGAGLPLDPISISKSGSTFRTAAIDSVYLITYVTNNTPAEMEFDLIFTDTSGAQVGKSFPSGIIAAGVVDQRIQFNLGPTDQDALNLATVVKLSFKIKSPAGANPVVYGTVRKATFTVKISFHAPVNVWKL